jgi:uncharacterized alkaline shock family protein YloU
MLRNIETKLKADISEMISVSVISVNVDIDYGHKELRSEK